MLRRRDFCRLLGILPLGLGLEGKAQQRNRIPVIGVLWHAENAQEEAAFMRPLREGFAAVGYVDGKSIKFEDRFAAEKPERFESLAVELAALKPDVLVSNTIAGALALQRATSNIPIVFVTNPDPVGLKLVSSLARPGGNITGLSSVAFDLATKRVQLLRDAIPGLTRLALLTNSVNSFDAERQVTQVQSVAEQLGLYVQAIRATDPARLEAAFEEMRDGNFGATIVTQNAMYFNERRRLADLALLFKMPTLGPADIFVEAGMLMAYGPDWLALHRNAGAFVNKILNGANPAELPVEQPTKFDLAVNAKTADALGIKLSSQFLARVDRVIE